MKSLVVALLFWAIVGIGACSYWYHKHPCIRSHEVRTTCGGETYCVVYCTIGSVMQCCSWGVAATYPCTVSVCDERAP